jgi:hypothetical protein
MEQWLPIPGHEGEYEVSDLGRVRSLYRRVRAVRNGVEATRGVPPRVLKPGRQGKCGHVSVSIGKGNTRLVHQLVMEAFVGPCPEGLEVRHLNGRGADNRLENLLYGTRSENNIDVFYTRGRHLDAAQVRHLRKRAAEGFYHGERYHLALEWGVNSATIYHALSGRQYSHVSD